MAQERDARRKERLEKESKDMRHVLELRGADLRTRNAMLAQELTKLERLEETFRCRVT